MPETSLHVGQDEPGSMIVARVGFGSHRCGRSVRNGVASSSVVVDVDNWAAPGADECMGGSRFQAGT